MVFISLQTPAFECKATSVSQIENICKKTFNAQKVQVYKLVEVTGNISPTDEIIVKIPTCIFSLNYVENLLQEKEKLRIQLEKCKQTLATYHQEIAQLKQYHLKESKITQVEVENKRIRNLLQQQLENQEVLKKETQSTVQTLRDEFNNLVGELINTQMPFKTEKPSSPVNIPKLNM